MRTFVKFLLVLPAVFAAPTVDPMTIPGSYIFKVRKGSALGPLVEAVFGILNILPTHVYSFGDFQGFSLDGVPSTIGFLASLAGIESIEPNTKVYASKLVTQKSAPWGLGRISHWANGFTDYVYDDTAGVDTYAYVIDTGIRTTHQDFEGRAIWGSNHVDQDNTDGTGHGTHVAGTIGSKTYGVAKSTTLIAVKVLDSTGAGSTANVLKGVEWVVNDATSKNRTGKAVVNLSLGGTPSTALNKAITAAVEQNLFVAVAAGNSATNAKYVSPASVPAACTVGATDRNDKLASFSNYGASVDVQAPGVGILGPGIVNDTATDTLSGTSMAAPHVAGLAAYLLALPGNTVPPWALCDYIKQVGTKGVVKLAPYLTTTDLAYNGNGA
ncbi:subtilase [Karstenula rhodostoma CBS 690.94]|uniref:Subtilase n=1 Tax=Karstenula rhodostoma CBS 690.94 TaxID=1392251 RepID=A0A9P4PU39_9PLEO|nr:subtilase [Karstenula rhodostoma CBS 690.94]